MNLSLWILVVFNFFVCADVRGSSTRNGRVKRVVGGERASIEDFPWIAELKVTFPQMLCGAVLINHCFVLTAAHCFKNYPFKDIRVILGTDRINYNSAVTRKSKKFIRYPTYDKTKTHDDIMLVKMNSPVTFSSKVKPIRLPVKDEFTENSTATVLGFGRLAHNGSEPTQLQAATLKIVPNNKCRNIYNSTLILSSNICAGGGKADACQGDSGSPLIAKTKGIYHVIGIVSWGVDCATPGYPGAYTRVSSYVNWIKKILMSYDLKCKRVGSN